MKTLTVKKSKPKPKRTNAVSKKSGEKASYKYEIAGITVLALGILLFLSLYATNTAGPFGALIKKVFTGFLGITSYLVPIATIFYAFGLIARGPGQKSGKLLYLFILILLIGSMIQAGYYRQEDYQNMSPVNTLVKFYNDGTDLRGGGVFGGLISLPFLLLFQTLGTIIILTALSIIDIILLTDISISGFFKKSGNRVITSVKGEVVHFKDKFRKNEEDTVEFNHYAESSPVSGNKVINFKIEKDLRLQKSEEKARQPKPEIKSQGNTSKNSVSKTEELENELFSEVRADSKAEPETEGKFEYMSGHKHEIVYRYPPLELLNGPEASENRTKMYRMQALEGARKLEETLASFGVSAKVVNISRGPAVTRYELQPSSGVKVSRIVNLSDDIALNLATSGVRIEAPIPGKAAVGIEVPNNEIETVYLKEVLEAPEFRKHKSKIAFALGKDISGECIVADIARMPHLLIAGATGSGKSVCINSIIMSILYKASADEVKMMMIDPKMVELGVYNGIPHMLIPVVTNPKKAAGALNWAVQEMTNTYKLFAEKGVRDLDGYNNLASKDDSVEYLPQILIIIDELSDLMMVAPNEVEDAICRLAQMARAAGMHLIVATQRPSVDVITGLIKANIPSRISFAVTSQVDSRTILDMGGAEKLLGRGDMLFYPVGKPKPIRVQGAYVSDAEVEKVVEFIKAHASAEYNEQVMDEINKESVSSRNDETDDDELLPEAIELVIESGQASVSFIQRKLRVGYARAARIIDQMEARGIVGKFEGSKPRQVLITKQQWMEMTATKAD